MSSCAESSCAAGPRGPVTVLLQGGVASGKSTVARLLAARGASVLDCDRIAHEELRAPEVVAAVRADFGDGVVGDDGEVSRPALAARVFDDPAALRRLEALLHPRVAARVAAALEAAAAPPGAAREVVVIDAAVADKMQLVPRYDVTAFVAASAPARRARAATRGWSDDELARREARQADLAEKRARADVVIENEGDLAETESHVERFWTDHVAPRR